MFIEIQQLEIHPIDFEEDFRPGVIDFGPELEQRGPLHSAGRAQLVEEVTHVLRGEHLRNALGQARSRHQLGWILADNAFAVAKLEEGAKRSQLARDGGFLIAARVEISHEFADETVVYIRGRK